MARTERIQLAGLSAASPVRIAHLSDLHSSPSVPNSLIEEAFARAIAQKPDLVCLTGDYVTDGQRYDASWYRGALSRLSRAIPVYASMGNHDGGEMARRGSSAELRKLLESSGIEVLHNRGAVWQRSDGARIELIGMADLWSGEDKPIPMLLQRTSAARIVLAHNPDSKDALAALDWSVMLSGHTHGGQVRLPIAGAPWLPVRDKRYSHGLYRWQGRHLHITSGVGSILGIRLNCPPEVVLLELTAAKTAPPTD